MRRKCALIMILVSLILLSSCAVHVYRDYIDKVPSWLIGEWKSSEKDFDRLYISSDDIRGWIAGREISVKDDLRYNCGVNDEYTIGEDTYYLELYYGGGRTKSFQFIKQGTDSFKVRYVERSYNTIMLDETFIRM